VYFGAFICYLSAAFFPLDSLSQSRRRDFLYIFRADMATILLGGTKTHLADKPFALFSLNLDCFLYLREAETMFFFLQIDYWYTMCLIKLSCVPLALGNTSKRLIA
jgi:hypothetical protein